MLKLAVPFIVALSAFASGPVAAQAAFPAKPVRLVVSAAPGGAGDTLARLLANEIETALQAPVYVENKPGAGSTLGYRYLANAEPDGYTMGLIAVSNIAIAGSSQQFSDLPDLREDLVAVGGVAITPHILVVKSDSGIDTFEDLAKTLREKGDALSFGSQGQNSSAHLEGELLNAGLGAKAVHVPYNGSAPALVGLLGGQTQYMFDSVAPVISQVQGGGLKVLASAGTERLERFPDVPTLAELGYPDIQSDNPLGVFMPKGAPAEAVAKLSEALRVAMQSAAAQDAINKVGLISHYLPAEALQQTVIDEYALWAPVVADVEGTEKK